VVELPGINIYKHVEMHCKHHPIVLVEAQGGILYKKPPDSVTLARKVEKSKRKLFGGRF